jgi:hypothetical protein
VIQTLLLSILIEGIIVAGYSLWRRRPLWRLLLALLAANILTQLLLWIALDLIPGRYLATLFGAESLIWLIEGVCLYIFPGTQIKLGDALGLSLIMNLASFGVGWFLPI